MIKKYFNNPSKIFLFSSLFLLILLLLPIYKVNYNFKISNYVFVLICFISAYYGLKIGFIHNQKKSIVTKKDYNIKMVYKICIIFSFVGIILTYYEFFIIRKIDLSFNFMLNKNKWLQGVTSFRSAIAAFFLSFSVFLIPLHYLNKKINNQSNFFLFSIILFILYIAFQILLGNRAPLIFIFTFVLICTSYLNNYFKIKYLIFILPFFIYSSGLIFDIRLKSYNSSLFDSLYFSGYSFLVSSKLSYLDNDLNNHFFLTSIYSIFLYLIHGFYEILYLIEKSEVYYDYGKNLFWLPIKLINVIFNIEFHSKDILRTGVYNTYISTFFRDFKLFSPIIIFIVFFIFAYPFKYFSNGNLSWFFTCSVIFLYLLSAPFFSPFASGITSYLLFNSIILKIMLSINKKNSLKL